LAAPACPALSPATADDAEYGTHTLLRRLAVLLHDARALLLGFGLLEALEQLLVFVERHEVISVDPVAVAEPVQVHLVHVVLVAVLILVLSDR
jgi:hypothetical protein